jgi:hypothetical protein
LEHNPKPEFPPSIMIYAVIGIGYKHRSFIVGGNINIRKYIQNINETCHIEDLDEINHAIRWRDLSHFMRGSQLA